MTFTARHLAAAAVIALCAVPAATDAEAQNLSSHQMRALFGDQAGLYANRARRQKDVRIERVRPRGAVTRAATAAAPAKAEPPGVSAEQAPPQAQAAQPRAPQVAKIEPAVKVAEAAATARTEPKPAPVTAASRSCKKYIPAAGVLIDVPCP